MGAQVAHVRQHYSNFLKRLHFLIADPNFSSRGGNAKNVAFN